MMLALEGVEAAYGPVKALRGISLKVQPSTIVAVLGANGAGKTTMLRSINGLVHPAAGTITYDGHDLTRCKVEDIVTFGVAQVPEGRGVITELTVEENLRLGSLFRSGRVDKAGLDNVYAMFPPLAQRRHKIADTLSGGERQMLAIGRALMSKPKVLLLDEPSLGLAPRITAQIFATLRRLRDEDGLAVLLVEQNARSALSVADEAVVLNLGEVVAQGPAAALATDETLRHAYLGF